MSDKIRVDVEKYLKILKEFAELEKIPLGTIEFYKNGKPIQFSEAEIEDWRFTGLGNRSFIEFMIPSDEGYCNFCGNPYVPAVDAVADAVAICEPCRNDRNMS